MVVMSVYLGIAAAVLFAVTWMVVAALISRKSDND